MAVIILAVILSFLSCLYLADGKYVLFSKGGFKTLMREMGEVVKEKEDNRQLDETKRKISVRMTYLKENKRLWIFGIVTAILAVAFYIFRQYMLVDMPILNIKYVCLLYIYYVISVTDLHYSIIPNELVLLGIVLWIMLVVYTVLVEKNSILTVLEFSAFGGLFGFGVLFVCRVLMKGSMGFGDIKLMGMTGLVCGFYKTFNILFYALIVLFFVGLFLMISKKADRHSKIPMGPFLLIGYIIAGVFGA